MKRGFTLIEIIVVVIILAIAAAIAVPYVGNMGSYKSTAAARIVMSDLFYAQNYAITAQKTVYVTFTVAEGSANSYKVTDKADGTGTGVQLPGEGNNWTVTFGPTASGPLNATKLSAVKVNGAAATVFGFDSLGQLCDSTGSATTITAAATVQVTDSAGKNTVTLTIQPYTGEISVQ